MAADVSSLVRLMNGGDTSDSTSPMTMDLLAGCCTLDSKVELDLDDLQVPCGWEKRLDLKSGKIYLERCNSSTSESKKPQQSNKSMDLNFPPESKQTTLNLFDDASLDLKLVSLSSTIFPSSSNYQSVCTLDKVKSALERAEKESTIVRKRSVSMSKSSSFRSNSSSSIKLEGDFDQEEKSIVSASFAAGCPSCLMYVLISKGNPKCPRCNCDVPFPKKPRIDLNISM